MAVEREQLGLPSAVAVSNRFVLRFRITLRPRVYSTRVGRGGQRAVVAMLGALTLALVAPTAEAGEIDTVWLELSCGLGNAETCAALDGDLTTAIEQLSRDGRTKEAISRGRRLLRLSEQRMGRDHPDTATSIEKLAVVYDTIGDYPSALPLYQRALAIRQKALGPEHPDTATSLDNVASIFFNMGDYPSAAPLYQRALAIREKAVAMGDYPSALPLFVRVLAFQE